ncbi:aminopeptidase [Bacillus lacus]|uniref:Aminopeptidase n=1 Tax=Metabacillus lacus TaxID=1983721 RepID=A0A7X2IYT5_9BACI|nr:aminopeptidase [Metabacillus lacus]MRX71638.1 aminopeptidase [Metabacillus lacus]
MSNFQQRLEKYADLAVKVGVNIQEGQTLIINASLESAELVRILARKAYETGAKHVHLEWFDDHVNRTKYELAPDEAFQEYPEWKARGLEEMAEAGAAVISIVSSDPDLLKGINPKRIAAASKAAGMALEKYRNYMQSDKISWCVLSAASRAWAQKVFPEAAEDEAVEKLWDAIFGAVRVDKEDPVAAWAEHNSALHSKVDYLNSKHYKALHYTAEGTDLTIELADKHLWVGAGSVNEKGHEFMANMPTEEVFTAPNKDGITGYVTSKKPLSYGGNLIDNFTFTFESGRIVDVKAEQGEEILKQLVETDEGSHYIGEVALVPHDSPISNSGVLFYNTLFDENASNHLALGNAYPFCIEGGKKMTGEELKKNGLNTSITHVDFMIGSADMNIDGIKEDGTREPLFKNGNWAF